jgi:hypothetical protein
MKEELKNKLGQAWFDTKGTTLNAIDWNLIVDTIEVAFDLALEEVKVLYRSVDARINAINYRQHPRPKFECDENGPCEDMKKMLDDGIAFFENGVYSLNLLSITTFPPIEYEKRIYHCPKCGGKL